MASFEFISCPYRMTYPYWAVDFFDERLAHASLSQCIADDCVM
jgi:hypothetical protein